MKVRWNIPIGIKDVIKEEFFIVERYEELGDIYMNFLPNDEVRVIVSRDGPLAPDYPIPHSGKLIDAPASN